MEGRWLLRTEGVEPPFEFSGSAAGMVAALPAFGLVADGVSPHHSQRLTAYDDACERVRSADRILSCWCGRSDLVASGGSHRDGRCVDNRDAFTEPASRTLAANIDINFETSLQRSQTQHPAQRSRGFRDASKRGVFPCQSACVVDDVHQGVTKVAHGRDLLACIARRIFLQQRVGLTTPAFRCSPFGAGRRRPQVVQGEQRLSRSICDAHAGAARWLAFSAAATADPDKRSRGSAAAGAEPF
jgi:glutamyl-Q tRNA(Asp) synthetase